MTVAPGSDLRVFIDEKQNSTHRITVDEWFQLATKVVTVVGQFHRLGFAHMDIKPENIMYDKSTKVMTLIDFGG
ncbi:hypothetical protein HDU93_002018, partial [Gonapodya sp. JEL0774]